MANDPRLRSALSEATQAQTAEDYHARFRATKAQFRHNVEMLPVTSPELKWFNCYAYALGVSNERRYLDLARRYQTSVLINSDFVADLLRSGELAEVQLADVQPNDVVLYFAGDLLKHGGRVVSVKPSMVVQSKWGPHEVHEHPLLELPTDYGDRVRYFHSPTSTLILERLEGCTPAS
jgi:hypothetical protein